MEDESGHDWEEYTYQIIRCRGCETLSVRRLYTTAGRFDPEGNPVYDADLYPPRATRREWLEHMSYLPDTVKKVYRKVVLTMNAELPLLSAIGLRTLIEAVCHDQNAKGDNLEKHIESLASSGVLSKPQAQILHSHRFLGNVAAHEITAPQPAELVAALKIAETILETLYVIPRLQEDIKTGRADPQVVQPVVKPERISTKNGTAPAPSSQILKIRCTKPVKNYPSKLSCYVSLTPNHLPPVPIAPAAACSAWPPAMP